MKNVTRNHW